MAVITIAYQIGCGGRHIGRALAQQLDYTLVDREIVQEAARQLQVSEEEAGWRDEHTESLMQRLVASLGVLTPPVYVPPEPGTPPIDQQTYIRATQSVIAATAKRGRVVIIGHGANHALRDQPGTLHVYFYAPEEQRIAMIQERDGLDRAEAAHYVATRDHERAQYVKRVYHQEWQAPLSFDLMINTAHFDTAHAVDLCLEAVHQLDAKG
jgi:cytidylate kinase